MAIDGLIADVIMTLDQGNAMARMKKSLMRGLAPSVLADRGLKEVRGASSGRGLLPGARLIAKRDGVEIDVAVKASLERSLNFTRQSKNRWRTASTVDLVVAVVPASNAKDIEVMAFDRKPLIAEFEKAWKALEKAGRSLSFEIPIFIPLDEVSRKNVGHNIANLKALAVWSVRLSAEEVRARTSAASGETFYERVKREFAERSGVDVSQVEVEFRIKS
jgi:hypothetical protein